MYSITHIGFCSSLHEQLDIMFNKAQATGGIFDDESSVLSNSTPYNEKTGLRRPPLPTGGQASQGKKRQRPRVRPVTDADFRYFLVVSATGLGKNYSNKVSFSGKRFSILSCRLGNRIWEYRRGY